MPAVHKNTVYKPLEVTNPYNESADKSFADILQDKMKEVRIWRVIGAGSLVLFAISLILFNSAIKMQQVVPVLVNVMPSGESQYLGEVRGSGSVQAPEAAVHYWIRKFITNLRSVPTDYQIMYNNIDECFIMVTSNYSPIMRRMLQNASPFELVGRIRRSVEIESVLNITSNSYQINWVENVIDGSSSPKNVKMRAVVTVRLITPSEATIKRNPLGIYIENFEMTEL